MSQFPESDHENIAQQAPHEASSSGSSGCASSSTYSTGGAGMASTQARAPSRNLPIIARDVSSHPAAIGAPARLMPTVRVKRSSSIVSSPKSSESRPFACFSARSSWKRRSPAVTNPCANHRSSSESAER